jgi:hypothetical protein
VVLKLFRMSERERGTKRQRDKETNRLRGKECWEMMMRDRVRETNRRSQKAERDTERRDKNIFRDI